jgi:general secretion pathway protein D
LRADLWKAIVLVLVAAAAAGCAAGRAYSRAERAARAGDWDMAVTYYTQAVQSAPQSAEYKIALERAQLAASRQHLDAGLEAENKGDLDTAIREYKKASEYDTANSRAAAKAVQLQQQLRDKLEAARPKPPVEQMKERARQLSEPILNPASREALRLKFAANTNIQDILSFIGQASGINILYDRDVRPQQSPNPIDLDGITLEQALNIVLTTNGFFYKILNEKTILVIPDNTTKRQQYEEQVIRTFYISNADVAELTQMLTSVMSGAGITNRPLISQSKTANTITVRGSAPLVAIVEQIIENNDKPRAEIVVDIEVLEVNRARAKQFGLNLSQYSINGQFSPEGTPAASTSSTGGTGSSTSGTTTSTSSGLFNLNTISRGVNTADFYIGVPSWQVRFLESDTQTKLIAKPSLRGAEGKKLTLNLGDEIPVPSTTFLPLVAGGVATSPSVSFNYRPVGVNLEATARVTLEGDVILDLSVESSTRGSDVNVSGQNLPSFGSRKVVTTMRLRDGESNLLAGLLRDDERKSLSGFPGAIHVPILKQLFSNNDNQVSQTDIVMLLTPHIIRTQGLSEKDFRPIYIGTSTNPGLGGPPPLIAPAGDSSPGAPAMQPAPAAGGTAGAARLAPPAAGTPGAARPTPPGGGAPGATPQPSVPSPGGVPAPPAAAPPGAVATPPGGAVPQPSLSSPAGVPAPPTAAPSGTQSSPAGAQPMTAGGSAQVMVTPPGTQFAVGAGPYVVPVSITNVNRATTLSLTVTFGAAAVRVRSVQEGSFMRQGGSNVAFAQQVDPAGGRIDLTLSRTGDTVGATGSGVLATLIFEAVAPGAVTFTPSGVASGPGGPIPLQFSPATITVR